MKKYNKLLPVFHTVYRLITTSHDIVNFSVGICHIYRNIFDAQKVTMVLPQQNGGHNAVAKIILCEGKQIVRKGGISILTRRERDILNQHKEFVFKRRFIYPFIFTETLGVIYVKRGSKSKNFNEMEKKMFSTLSEEVSVGLKLFNMYIEEKKTIISYIKSLTKLLDQFIPTSYFHNMKGSFRLIKIIGKELNLSESETKSLEYASLLHDAGKIHLPQGLLRKQRALTEDEFRIIMKHPKKGVELIRDVEALKPVFPMILHHHERYDGKGYPSKLKREDIPLGSRILSIIDAFDAMYYGRPYRKKRSLEEVEGELEKQKGKQFDPKVVDIFLKILQSKNFKKHLFAHHKK